MSDNVPLSRKSINDLLGGQTYQLVERYFEEIVGYVDYGTTPNTVPFNGPAPLITQGHQVFNFNFIPRETGSTIKLNSSIMLNTGTQADSTVAFLCIDGASSAVKTHAEISDGANRVKQFYLKHEITSTGASINFQIRVGANANNTGLRINSSDSNLTYGNTISTWVEVEEFALI